MKTHTHKNFNLIIAGGGTGGHVSAGIALAQELKEKEPNSNILFVGARSGLEEVMVPKAGFDLKLLKVGKIKGLSTLTQARTILGIPAALIRSILIIIKHNPTAVIGVGGYASGPFILAAFMCKSFRNIKTAILEQNAVPGLTNKLLSKFVNHIFLAFPITRSIFPKDKILVTGNPIRKSLKSLSQSTFLPFTVFIFGGSQGAAGINQLIIEALPYLENLKINWIHQTGEKDFSKVLEAHKKLNRNPFQVEKFIHDMQSTYEKATLVICRSGASTLAELALVGRAALLIPFPNAADDHQTKNAKNFSELTGALILEQNATLGKQLAEKITLFYENPSLITEIETKTRLLHTHSAAQQILEILMHS